MSSGTPRGVHISVGASPTRQLTIRAEVKGIVNSVRGYKLRDLYSSPRVASKQTVMRKREHTGFVNLIATDEPSEDGEICHCIEAHERLKIQKSANSQDYARSPELSMNMFQLYAQLV